jgi:hypothetical protein
VGRFVELVAFFTGRCVVIFVKANGVDKLSSMSESIIRAIWLKPLAGALLQIVSLMAPVSTTKCEIM